MNVDDGILSAYQARYPSLAEDHSLHEPWVEAMDRGEESMTGFMSGIKGKAAEFGAADQLREARWTEDPRNPRE